MILADIVGYEELDTVADLIKHRREVTRSSSVDSEKNGVVGRLQTRQEREEALRRQDYEHKHAALGPSLNRDGPQYPHVYRTHEAGNKLSAHGRAYTLPEGSTHRDEEVLLTIIYEFFKY